MWNIVFFFSMPFEHCCHLPARYDIAAVWCSWSLQWHVGMLLLYIIFPCRLRYGIMNRLPYRFQSIRSPPLPVPSACDSRMYFQIVFFPDRVVKCTDFDDMVCRYDIIDFDVNVQNVKSLPVAYRPILEWFCTKNLADIYVKENRVERSVFRLQLQVTVLWLRAGAKQCARTHCVWKQKHWACKEADFRLFTVLFLL